MRVVHAVVAVLALGGCALTGPGGDPADVSVAIGGPAELLPSAAGDRDSAQVLAALFTPLVRYDDQRRPVPAAASAVTSKDNRTWRITLADGYTFHDGSPVTAADYVTAWNYAAYGPNRQRNAYLLDRVQGFADMQGDAPPATTLYGLKAADERTVEVRLALPFPDFPAMLGHPAFLPLPAAAWESPGRLRPGFAGAVVGQGPYRLAGGDGDDGLRVERYDAHPAPGRVGSIEFRVYPSSGRAYRDLLDGDLDVDAALPPGELAGAAERLGDRYAVVPTSTMTFLAAPGLADPRARQAVSMALDRDALVAAHAPGSEQPARSFVPPLVPGHRADACGAPCRHDPGAARALYAAANGPAELTVAHTADGGHADWVTAACAQLTAALAVTCTPAPYDTLDALLDEVRRGAPVSLFRMSWSMDYPSMESYLTPLFTAAGSSNYGGYQSGDVDTLAQKATTARNAATATALHQQIEDVLVRDMPAIPLRWGQRAVGHSERVTGVTLDVYEVVDVTRLELR
ncbi:peptide ABC transporter substrate-binding protein [Spirilliplanes yamanashiensis]|uniref:Putative peptide ABC transporter DppA n=1 Tax=Spirilliplanes yamanashiensis TaxID=42233 RepID=A0A8J3YAB3_9ACTN|nr:ABC transporter substrate-binding protein [Spirilliplanes yamanashiensis]MDP9815994.1 peptide/nickel transport system substrate-binding protein/oligopeptide transport system substrate-binding protein [Spirilliplanes yamanashiensis]GIJ04252.1 putative peptide ABC transporter DppA [Spirilliplanes yamanashiensis]